MVLLPGLQQMDGSAIGMGRCFSPAYLQLRILHATHCHAIFTTLDETPRSCNNSHMLPVVACAGKCFFCLSDREVFRTILARPGAAGPVYIYIYTLYTYITYYCLFLTCGVAG